MVRSARRFDLAQAGKAERTPQGFLRIPVTATRTGVFNYYTPDGKLIRELRHPDEVFHPDSIASLMAAPVTLRHPPKMVDPANFREFSKGYLTGDVKAAGNKLETTCIVADEAAIKAIEDGGMREVSCGYMAELLDEPGEYEGVPYDIVQKNIRYNHLAIVDRGRAGPEVRLRLDADDALAAPLVNKPPKENETMKVKVTLGGQEFEVEQALADEIKKLQDEAATPEMDDAKAKASAEDMAKMKDAKDAAMKESEVSKAKADALTEQLKARTDSASSEEVIRERVKARVSLEKVATVLGVAKIDELSDMDLKKACVVKHSPSAKLDGKSEVYVDTRFDAVAEQITSSKHFDAQLAEALTGKGAAHQDSAPDSNDARKKMMERSDAAWNPKK